MMPAPLPNADDDPGSTRRGGLPFLRFAVLLCPDFTLTPMASFVDALRLAADRGDQSRQIYFQWDFFALTEAALQASCGLAINATAWDGDLDGYGCIVICGGLLPSLPGVDPALRAALTRAIDRGATVVGLCSASVLLAETGLLDGRRCATHFDVLGGFLRRFPSVDAVSNENYIIDGPIITCPGSIVAIEVAAHLIATHGDRAKARKAQNFLLFRPEEERIALKERPYAETLDKAGRLTRAAVKTMETRLDAPCSVDALAVELNTTRSRLTRAFARDLGTGPAEFWRKIRLQAACEALLDNRRSITEIAFDAGFADTAHFCSAFRKAYGRSPRAYRKHRGK